MDCTGRVSRVFSGLALALIALTGCSAATETAELTETTSAPDPTATGPNTDWRETVPGFFSRYEDGTCVGERLSITDESRYADSARRVGDFIVPPLTDGGPATYAEGDATLDDDGYAIAYVVADGDTPQGIADRFCSTKAELALLNYVRRNTSYSSGTDDPSRVGSDTDAGSGWIVLYEGDTINLDPATITTVGDENGTVYDHDPDIHLPPQQ